MLIDAVAFGFSAGYAGTFALSKTWEPALKLLQVPLWPSRTGRGS